MSRLFCEEGSRSSLRPFQGGGEIKKGGKRGAQALKRGGGYFGSSLTSGLGLCLRIRGVWLWPACCARYSLSAVYLCALPPHFSPLRFLNIFAPYTARSVVLFENHFIEAQ